MPLLIMAQEKQDWEARIDASLVPVSAVQWISGIEFNRPVKWYEEHSHNEVTYEAKGFVDDRHYSIEFLETGDLKDIEMEISKAELPVPVRKTIDSLFTKVRIITVQTQWIGNDRALRDLIVKQTSSGNYRTDFEMLVRGKRDGRTKIYELLLSEHGVLLQLDEVVFRNSALLDF